VEPLAPERYSVSRVDRYVTCPFKYFAERILRLPEEREDMSGLTPIERGTFLHLLLERFFGRWQEAGHGAITAANLPEAQAMFAALAEEHLAGLPAADRIVERLRVVGSIVAPGVADRVFELEANIPGDVVERLLEIPLEGDFTFPAQAGFTSRTIAIRGKADRVDVLADGSLRVIDYKLGRMPDLPTSIQLGVYAHCVRVVTERRDGRAHPVSAAMYLAFGDDRRFEGRLADRPAEMELAVQARASSFSAVIDRIESGEFPPQPRRTSECQWCGAASVCRKEYRVEDDEAAESV
jgi:RecB family exonuclease